MPTENGKNTKESPLLKDIKSGTTNLGFDYESLLPAFFALKFLEDSTITSFVFKLNPSSYDKFDDLVIWIKRQNDKSEQFAFQLKHRQRGKDLLEANHEFIRKGKGFNMDSYLEKFLKLKEEPQDGNTKCVLFTNATFYDLHKVRRYKIKKSESFFPGMNTENVYEIENKFFLCSGQKNVEELNRNIIELFGKKFHADDTIATCYIDFFGKLRKGNYNNGEISKNEVILKLTHLLLGNQKINIPLVKNRNEKLELIERVFQQFDIVVVPNVDKKNVQNNWNYVCSEDLSGRMKEKAIQYKIIPSGQSLTISMQQHVLSYFERKPLFLEVNEESLKTIYAVLDLSKFLDNIKLNFVLIGGEIDTQKFSSWKLFRNLTDLKKCNSNIYKKFIETFKISFQGRAAKSIRNLKEQFELHLDGFITPNEVFQLLTKDLLFGKPLDPLPKPHIERYLIRIPFNSRYLKKMCEQNTMVVHCNEQRQLFRQYLKDKEPDLEVTDITSYEQNPSKYKKPVLILTNQLLPKDEQLSYYHLKLNPDNSLEWSEPTVSPNAPEIFDNQLNAICGNTGIGKTTMMNYLAHRCPLRYWKACISLRHVDQTFLKSEPNFNKILDHLIYKNQNKTDFEIIDFFLRKKKVMFFFDGLNELSNDCNAGATKIINFLAKEGYKICMFCTENARKILENDLNIHFIYDIAHFTINDQIQYVKQRLKNTGMSEADVEAIIRKIFNGNIEVNTTILKIPLYLYVVAEILSEDKHVGNLEDILTVTKMYSRFIDGKLQHNLRKEGYEEKTTNLSLIINIFQDYYVKQCQIGALKYCLESDIFESLCLKNDTTFLEQIKKHRDFLGLIVSINKDSLIFAHNSFAIYFAAIWLSENFEKIPDGKRKFIFQEMYNEVRYFFNIKLAEGCPLHLAILNQDVSKVKKIAEKHLNELDGGGRTPLHLAASLLVFKDSTHHHKMGRIRSQKSVNHGQILEHLLSLEVNPLAKDSLFQWNCFQYADASNSLYSLEKLSEIASIEWNYLTNYQDLFELSRQCVTFGYVNIIKKLIDLKSMSYFEELEKMIQKPPLHLSLESGQKNMAKLLIECGANLEKVDKQKRTALHEAAIWDNLEIAELLLHKNLKIEARDSTGKTPLQYAAKMGHKALVALFVDNKANVNTRDDVRERTPLHKASYTGKAEVVKYLIEHGAKVDIPDTIGKTPLQRASEMGHLKTVQCLIENGANINATEIYRKTMLHFAAYEGHKNVVEYLLEKDANISVKDEDGKTALQIAYDRGNNEILEILESAQKVISLRKPITDMEYNQLHQAVRKGNLEKIRQLLEAGAYIEETNPDNETILHIASLKGHLDIVKYLLQKGANTAAVNYEGRVPLHFASMRGHVNIVKELINRGQDLAPDRWKIIPIQRAAYKGHLEVVKAFVDAGIDPNTFGGLVGTPLHSAALGGQIDIIDYLISRGVAIGTKNNDGLTCLHVAAQRGCTEAVEHVIDLAKTEKNFLDSVDHRKRTALHWAAEKGYKYMIKSLVEGGADINLVDSNNQTALDIAKCLGGRDEIVEYLQNQVNLV